MSVECWFCEKRQVNEDSPNNLVYVFKKQSHADKIKNNKKEDNYQRKTVIVGRCDECFAAHEECKRLNIFCIIPYFVLCIGIFMMFKQVNPVFIAVVLMLATFGFGIVLYTKKRYLRNKNIKALVQVGIKNEEIQHYLSDGWYR